MAYCAQIVNLSGTNVLAVDTVPAANPENCALVAVTGSEFKSFRDSASMWPPLTVADSLNIAVPIILLLATAFSFRLLVGFLKSNDELE